MAFLFLKTIILSTVALFCTGSHQFDKDRFIKADPLRCAGNAFHYEAIDTTVTRPPCGYKPFYISHISRHGSRTTCNESDFRHVDSLRLYASRGMLAPGGDSLLVVLDAIRKANAEAGFGNLTDRGAWEHREIARRMGTYYPEVFPDGGKVVCYSTDVGRVLNSMDNFKSSLEAIHPSLEFSVRLSSDDSHSRYEVKSAHLSHEMKEEAQTEEEKRISRAILSSCDFSSLTSRVFKDGKAPKRYKGREASFFYSLYRLGVTRQAFLNPPEGSVESFFTPEQLYAFSNRCDVSQIFQWGYCTENKGHKTRSAARIIRCIIEDADAAIAGNGENATLRFTHDTYLLPVMIIMGLPGADYLGPLEESWRHNSMSYTIHMAANVQLVFYRNKRGKVIVKVLLNEIETVIPGLAPDYKGLYYKWDTLKDWLETRLQTI